MTMLGVNHCSNMSDFSVNIGGIIISCDMRKTQDKVMGDSELGKMGEENKTKDGGSILSCFTMSDNV